jgi:hypothetical protein
LNGVLLRRYLFSNNTPMLHVYLLQQTAGSGAVQLQTCRMALAAANSCLPQATARHTLASSELHGLLGAKHATTTVLMLWWMYTVQQGHAACMASCKQA